MTTLHMSTCSLAHLLIPSNLLSFAYSFIPSICYHLLAHSHCQTIMHSLTHSCFHTLSCVLVSSLTHLTYPYLCIPSKTFSFSHLLNPSNTISVAYSFPIHTLTCPLTVTDLFLKCILTCSTMQFFELIFLAHPFISSNPPTLKDSHLSDKSSFI